MMAYTPNGRVHRVLQHLELGHAKFGHIARTVHGSEMTYGQRTRLWRLIGHMLEADLIRSVAEGYVIQPAGEEVLRGLDGVSGRIFAKPVAEACEGAR